MIAARLHGPADLRVEAVPAPASPGAEEVLLRIDAVGVCGSDLHMYETGGIGGRVATEPVTLGHEFMGTVIEAGPGTCDGLGRALKAGQRVAVDPAVPCGRCENCAEGNPNLCPTHVFFGVPPDNGALCERFLCPGGNCFPLPDAMSDDAGAMLEPLGVAIHALDLARIEVGRSVAIFGAGPIGLLILRLAVIAGAGPIHVFEPLEARRQRALALGATAAWDVPLEGAIEPLSMLPCA